MGLTYGNSYYDEVVQYLVYDTGAFWADVGGLIGLFLGVSMLSLYDFVVAFATCVWRRITIWREKKVVKQR